MAFSRQGCWSSLPFPPLGDLPDPGIEHVSPALRADSLPPSHWGRFLRILVWMLLRRVQLEILLSWSQLDLLTRGLLHPLPQNANQLSCCTDDLRGPHQDRWTWPLTLTCLPPCSLESAPCAVGGASSFLFLTQLCLSQGHVRETASLFLSNSFTLIWPLHTTVLYNLNVSKMIDPWELKSKVNG